MNGMYYTTNHLQMSILYFCFMIPQKYEESFRRKVRKTGRFQEEQSESAAAGFSAPAREESF